MNAESNSIKRPIIIANSSAFYGDRLSAAREMIQGGPIDVLTGDYLAELTMAILFRDRLKDSDSGVARTFLKQMEDVMGECLDKGIRVVSNAGGLNPRALAERLEAIADSLGLHPKIAYIEGDDILNRLEDLQQQGEPFINLDKGISLQRSRRTTHRGQCLSWRLGHCQGPRTGGGHCGRRPYYRCLTGGRPVSLVV